MAEPPPPHTGGTDPSRTRSQDAFLGATEDTKQLIRSVLQDERNVMHLKRRPEIHQKILDHVKRIVR